MEPRDRPRSRRKGTAELLAQRVAERLIDIVVQAVDINALLQMVDLNALLERVDVNTPLKQVDLNALLRQVDLNAPLREVDLNALLARVDVNTPLKQVDVNTPLKQVDLNALLKQVDLNALLKQVDLNEVLEQVDVDAVLDRVDINDVVARIDMERLVEQTDLGAIIARSTGGLATHALDTMRSGAVGLDRRIDRWVTRLLRRKEPGPLAPPALLGQELNRERPYPPEPVGERTGPVRGLGIALRGVSDRPHRKHCPVFARAGDHSFVVQIVTGSPVSWHRNDIVVAIIYLAWQFLYFGFQWAADGSTWGMALLGVQVVQAYGTRLDPWRGWVRSLTFPLGFLTLGLGFLGFLVQREHRALYDLIAGTAVVYAWDARAARLRFLARQAEPVVAAAPTPAKPSLTADGPSPAGQAGLEACLDRSCGIWPAPRTICHR